MGGVHFKIFTQFDLEIFSSKIEFRDELDLIRKVLYIYSKVVNINQDSNYLSSTLINVLSFYILRGYSTETKNLIKETFNIKTTNLNQINSKLTNKGFLIPDNYNYSHKKLSKELQTVRDYFLKGELHKKLYLIEFSKK